MNCEDSRKNFHNYLDSEMKPRESYALETHLKTCFHCKAELGVLQRTVRLVGEIEPLLPPRGFDQRILSEMGFEVVPFWRRAVSYASVFLTGIWLFLIFSWTLHSLWKIPDALKFILHIPARFTFLPDLAKTLLKTGNLLITTSAVILRNIPSFYWLSIVLISLLLTLLLIKSLTLPLKEANHV